jgi:hypothetical protein
MTPSQTSMSDEPGYREFCRRAAEDDAVFAGFREQKVYADIVSSTLAADGVDCLATLTKRDFDFGFFDRLREHDRIGGPRLVDYPHAGTLAPQTLRCVKVMSDLEALFGSLEGKSIVEIGCGFGALTAVVAKRARVARYTLVDLPEPLMLAERYLRTLGITDDVAFSTREALPPLGAHDLAISVYGLSEIARPIQLDYWQKLLRGARAGYLLWNSGLLKQSVGWQRERFGGEAIYAEEMCSLIPGAHLLAQDWLSDEDIAFTNQLMVWGDGAADAA